MIILLGMGDFTMSYRVKMRIQNNYVQGDEWL